MRCRDRGARRGQKHKARTARRPGRGAARAERPSAPELKREIEQRLTRGACAYCGAAARPERPLTREHIVPRSRGAGRREWRVIVPACVECNRRRGAQPLAAFLLACPARVTHVLAYLDSLPPAAARQVDLRVFAELLAAVLLRDELGRDDPAPIDAVPERLLQRRRRAARLALERLRQRLERGGGGGRFASERSLTGVWAARGGAAALAALARVLAGVWSGWEVAIAGELVAHRPPPARAAPGLRASVAPPIEDGAVIEEGRFARARRAVA